jgi:hypothetical protein
MRSERKQWCADRTVAHVLAAVTPPGYFTTGTSTTKCAANSYRAGWATGTSAASCMPCGNGLSAVDDTQVVQYSTAFPYVATNVGVTTVPQSCCEWPVKLTAGCSAYDAHPSGGTHMPLAALESCTVHATPLNVCPRPMPKHHACSTGGRQLVLFCLCAVIKPGQGLYYVTSTNSWRSVQVGATKAAAWTIC